MPVRKLKGFLDNQNLKYVTISRSAAYTAQEIAASAHIPGKDLAKLEVPNPKKDGRLPPYLEVCQRVGAAVL
jgi:Ala-tRNA(Pro) deacylase